MADWTLKQNDDAPAIEALLSYDDGSVPSSMSSVVCKIRLSSGGSLVTGGTDSIMDAGTARVRHDWSDGGIAAPGTYNVEWEVTFTGGRKTTFPAQGYMTLEITDDLDA